MHSDKEQHFGRYEACGGRYQNREPFIECRHDEGDHG